MCVLCSVGANDLCIPHNKFRIIPNLAEVLLLVVRFFYLVTLFAYYLLFFKLSADADSMELLP